MSFTRSIAVSVLHLKTSRNFHDNTAEKKSYITDKITQLHPNLSHYDLPNLFASHYIPCSQNCPFLLLFSIYNYPSLYGRKFQSTPDVIYTRSSSPTIFARSPVYIPMTVCSPPPFFAGSKSEIFTVREQRHIASILHEKKAREREDDRKWITRRGVGIYTYTKCFTLSL